MTAWHPLPSRAGNGQQPKGFPVKRFCCCVRRNTCLFFIKRQKKKKKPQLRSSLNPVFDLWSSDKITFVRVYELWLREMRCVTSVSEGVYRGRGKDIQQIIFHSSDCTLLCGGPFYHTGFVNKLSTSPKSSTHIMLCISLPSLSHKDVKVEK